LGVIYDRHRRLVYRTSLAICNDQEAAADLLQDVFCARTALRNASTRIVL
jgi:DNA-directed RNA polymerase specialized sigma24 family protein